jgi:hypothetical protein
MDFKDIGKSSRNIILGIAIFILTMFVVVYGVNTFYEKPQYEDFCGDREPMKVIYTEQECIDTGGVWNPYQATEIRCPGGETCPTGYCDLYYKCGKDYDAAMENWSRYVFFISIPLTIFLIVLGAFVFHLDPVGLGLMFGGIGTLIYGAGSYWRYSNNLFKFIISLMGLIILIFLAYYFNERIGKRKKKR